MPAKTTTGVSGRKAQARVKGRCSRQAALVLVLLWVSVRPALPGPAVDWRFCYAGSERDRRFYLSQPFPSATPMEAIEQQWLVWLSLQALQYETTGCPRGAERAAIEDSIAAAIRYNARQGRSAVKLDWKPAS